MRNYLKMSDNDAFWLLELGWPYRRIERETGVRRIERETGVRRETIARYDPRRQAKAANLSIGFGESANDELDLLASRQRVRRRFVGRGRWSTMSAAAEPVADVPAGAVTSPHRRRAASRLW
jgi:hypothetical protein